MHFDSLYLQQYLNVSYRLTRKARELRKADGVLASDVLKIGKKLPQEIVCTVITFY